MTAFSILDLKAFTSQLFLQDNFDQFLVSEAVITTGNTITIDGRIQKDYYSEEELEALPDQELSCWKAVRPLCYQIIKGKRLPKSFRIVLGLSGKQTAAFLIQRGLPLSSDEVAGIYLNLRYEKGNLQIVTGTSQRGFSMDRSLDKEWDASVRQLLKQQQIAFEEI